MDQCAQNPTAVTEYGNQLFSAYPTPTSPWVEIRSESDIASIALYTVDGKLLKVINDNKVNLSKMGTGLYLGVVTDVTGVRGVVKMVRK